MSWLGGNWYGVIAFFGIPACLGIICWIAVHSMLGSRARREQVRQQHRRMPQAHVPQARTMRRPF